MLTRTALALCGVCAGLLLLEGAVRLIGPSMLEYDGGPEHLHFHRPELLAEEYRAGHPCLGDDRPARGEGARLLFLGDSVTKRGRIISALKKHHSGEKLQWLNAGIAGYNTTQEVRLYSRSCRQLRADHVILTMHNNDLQQNRLIFQRPFSQRQVQLEPERLCVAERLLVYHSHVYRLLLGRPGVVGLDPEGPDQWAKARRQLAADLTTLRAQVKADGGRLTVMLLPSMRTGRVPMAEHRARLSALRVLHQLGVRYFDLYREFQRAAASGVTLHEAPGDLLHPSQALADRFAEFLHREGLLAGKTNR